MIRCPVTAAAWKTALMRTSQESFIYLFVCSFALFLVVFNKLLLPVGNCWWARRAATVLQAVRDLPQPIWMHSQIAGRGWPNVVNGWQRQSWNSNLGPTLNQRQQLNQQCQIGYTPTLAIGYKPTKTPLSLLLANIGPMCPRRPKLRWPIVGMRRNASICDNVGPISPCYLGQYVV